MRVIWRTTLVFLTYFLIPVMIGAILVILFYVSLAIQFGFIDPFRGAVGDTIFKMMFVSAFVGLFAGAFRSIQYISDVGRK
jgi:hypothetical protein